MLDDDFDNKSILNTMSEGVTIHDLNGLIIYANDKASEILGLDKDQICGKTSLDTQWQTVKEDMSIFKNSDHPVMHTLQTQEPKHDVIMGIYRPNQDLRWININSNPIFKEGIFKGAVVNFSDITQALSDSNRIRRQSQYLEVILEATPMIVFAINHAGIFTFSAGSGLRPLGFKDGEAVGQSAYDLYAQYSEVVTRIKAALSGEEQHYQVQIGELYYLSHLVPQYDLNKRITGLFGISIDITESEKNKKTLMLQTRQAQIGEMLSMIAHQWRQPLAAINANLLQIRIKLELGECVAEKLIPIEQKTEAIVAHLSDTIDDFRDFFKPDRKEERIFIDKIINAVLALMQSSLKNQNIEISLHDETRSLELYSFWHDLVQVFINLFGNVLDISRDKALESVKIDIYAFEEENRVVIEVEDNAGGIQPEHLDKLFMPYFTTKGKLQGTGLGLYMCQNIIEDHCKGKMVAFNRNDGAVFRIELPLNIKE